MPDTFSTIMTEQVTLQQILINKFEEMRIRNPQFSRRAFSRRIGLSPGATSELLNGKRQVSAKVVERIVSRLSLDPQERAELLAFFKKKEDVQIDKVDPSYLQLSADQFCVIGDWYHFAILTLMRTKDFKSDSGWISKRLGLTSSLVRKAISRLVRLGLVDKTQNGNWKRSKIRYRTSDDKANASVRRAHFQYLDNAKEALQNLNVDQRDFTSLMMTLSPEQLPLAKVRIRKFQGELSKELEQKLGPEVFQLCIQLFPLTKITGAKK